MPHSIVLPLADERETFGFHVEDLSKFALELSLYPTFGSKVIGRAVILSSTIQNIHKSELLQVPLLDHHLKAIGEVAFYVECIRPFADAQLEIGGRVETYWKSTTIAPPTSAAQDHAHQFQPHRPLSVSTTSPSMRSTPGQGTKKAAAKDVEKSGFVTASSLAGDYLHMVVQVTRDYIPVVHSNWALPYPGLTLGVSDVTGAQYTAISNVSLHQAMTSRFGGNLAQISLAEWHQAINTSNFTLEDILMVGTLLCTVIAATQLIDLPCVDLAFKHWGPPRSPIYFGDRCLEGRLDSCARSQQAGRCGPTDSLQGCPKRRKQ